MSVGSTLPGLGRWNRPYLIAELISTAIGPPQPMPAKFAASRSVHSFPALFSSYSLRDSQALKDGMLGVGEWRATLDGSIGGSRAFLAL